MSFSSKLATQLVQHIEEFLSEYTTVEEVLEDKQQLHDILTENIQAACTEAKLRVAKPKRDPNKPKGITRAYIWFTKEKREEAKERVKAESEEVKQPDVMRMLGVMWGELSDEDKQPYYEKEKEDEARYEEEMESYVPSPGYEQIASKSKRDPSKPRGARSKYIFFQEDERKKLTVKGKEAAQVLSQRWKDLQKSNKKPDKDRVVKYTEMAEQDKQRHEEEMAVWDQDHGTIFCDYEYTRGKRTGEICGRRVKTEGTDKCDSHIPPDFEHGCQFEITRGERKGQVCGKKVKDDHDMCTTHLRQTQELEFNIQARKKSTKRASKPKETKPSKPTEPEPSEDENFEEEEYEVEIEPVVAKKTCSFAPKVGRNKGQICGTIVLAETNFCSKHQKKI